VRLPLALDEWFVQRLDLKPEKSASELLVSLVLGGLRLRDGYMAVHRRSLEHYATTGQNEAYRVYRRALHDTFGRAYVEHLERWLEADGVKTPVDELV
jgi:hypothetical protein